MRDRVKELRRVRASELVPHEMNWRQHPPGQQKVIRAALQEIGFAGAVLVREREDGKLVILDGHLRANETRDELIPVLVLDVDEADGAKILASHDPIGAMAAIDGLKLETLVKSLGESRLIEGLAKFKPTFENMFKRFVSSEKDNYEQDKTDEEMEAIGRKWAPKQGDKWDIDGSILYVGDSSGDPSRLVADPHQMIFDPPFDVDYQLWPLPRGLSVCSVWGRGRQRLVYEANHIVPDETWGGHELVLVGGVRGQHRPSLPCCLHDVIHVWRKRWWTDEADAIDARVIRASECGMTEDGRPRSVQQNCGGVLTGAMSWGKPVLAMEILIAYSPAGSIIWDPCAGSGSSLLAAAKHGRKWVGVEGQERWAALIMERAKNAGLNPRRIDSGVIQAYAPGAGAGAASGKPRNAGKKKKGASV